MYSNFPYNYSSDDERFGFLGPFLLGGIAGGLISPFFYNGGYNNNYYPQPYYNNYYYIPYPYYYRKK